VIVVMLLGTAGGVKAFTLACDGSLEGLRYLRDVRTRIQVATALPPTPTPASRTPVVTPTSTQTRAPTIQPTPGQPTSTSTPVPPTFTPIPTPVPTPPPPTVGQRARALGGIVVDAALGALLRLKQSDTVAYPSHIVAAHVLDAAGCGTDAVRLQWLKAGLHASRDGQPEQVAVALKESATSPDDLAQLRDLVREWTEQQRWSAPMRRVHAAFDALPT
jgi:hypothetical protein